jgi:hypothetical protein
LGTKTFCNKHICISPTTNDEAPKKRERESKSLTAEQIEKRRKECAEEWVKYGNNPKTLEISDDGMQFACNMCSAGDELEWHQLRGPSDIRRHLGEKVL